MRLPRAFYIPENAENVLRDLALEAEVYLYRDDKARPCAAGFSGNRAKPDFRERFANDEVRQRRVDGFLRALKSRQEARQATREARGKRTAAFRAKLEPGAVLCDSWGWEQTNVDFWQVLEVVGNRVKLVELGLRREGEPTGWASEYVIPGGPVGEPIWKYVLSDCVKINDSVRLRLWDGKPLYRSWYA